MCNILDDQRVIVFHVVKNMCRDLTWTIKSRIVAYRSNY